ncbi:MAG TPA: aromatic-ring-hydroxylating dioxygenase subunit beta [Chloroflexota bacterium]
MSALPADRDLQYEVEQFLYREAWLLDRRRFHDWLDLFAEDARYWMPARETTPESVPPADPARGPVGALFNDDKAFLGLRIQRLDTGLAHAEQPPSRTRHLVSNVQVLGRDDARAEVEVHSCFLLFQSRLESSEHLFAGEREDVLRRVDGGWRIVRRKVLLDHARLPRVLTTFF